MAKPTYLIWADGRKLTLDEIHQLTGLEIRRPRDKYSLAESETGRDSRFDTCPTDCRLD